jgi:hypothetical protein
MRRLVPLLAILCISGATATVARAQTAPGNVSWSSGARIGADWGSLSCPALDFCAIGGAGESDVYVSARPLNPKKRFARLRLNRIDTTSLSCPTVRLCVAGGRSDHIVAATRATVHGISFHRVGRMPQGVVNVACHGDYCAASGVSSFAFSATPAKPGSWVRRAPPAHTDTEFTSCSAIGVCVVAEGHLVYTIEQPQVRSHRWRESVLDPRDGFEAGDCAGAACLVPTHGGEIFANPDVSAAGVGAWSSTVATNLTLEGAGCLSVSRCYALAQKLTGHRITQQTLLYSNNPFAATPVWQSARIPVSGATSVQGFDCPSANVCLVETTRLVRHAHRASTSSSRILVAHIA